MGVIWEIESSLFTRPIIKKGRDHQEHGYGGGCYDGGDRSSGNDECFVCGRLGHWARDCPSSGFVDDRYNARHFSVRNDQDHSYSGGSYASGGRGRGGGDRSFSQDECFRCNGYGYWARDCPSVGGGRGGDNQFSSRSRFGGGVGHGDNYADRFDSIDNKYGGRRSHYANDRCYSYTPYFV